MSNSINGIVPFAASQNVQQKEDPSEISMDDFLKILAASMSNPTVSAGGSSEGGGNQGTDYISQFVQFTSLQQLKEIGDTMQYNLMMGQQQQAFSLIGKQVTIQENESEITGTVEKVRFINGFATLVVDGKEYNMASIKDVGMASEK
ncbi:MAG TPA: flagellar basal body rod modification protein [Candidatus Tetragenococcus pullicola]|nr:flagellar basal body rod modification protein [Candidatus Tetragenococcus pullicola]